jgi:glycogen debranching enzyme
MSYKKIIAFALALSLAAMSFAGCSRSDSSSGSEESSSKVQISSKETDMDDTISQLDLDFTANDLDVGYDDDTLRPNQLYTLSLPFSILDEKQGEEMLKIITEKLYVGRGLRTLPEDDSHYHGIYEGEMKVRDEAYHQGTSWAYLIGPYLRADYRIYHNKVRTLALLEPLLSTLDEQCINGITEIFDGDSPHTGKGCVTQAWSIAEVLCIYSLIKNGASNFKDTYGS